MLEKLLLAATITASLNFFVSNPWQTETSASIATQSRKATVQVAKTTVDEAPQEPNYPNFFLSWFQQKKPGS